MRESRLQGRRLYAPEGADHLVGIPPTSPMQPTTSHHAYGIHTLPALARSVIADSLVTGSDLEARSPGGWSGYADPCCLRIRYKRARDVLRMENVDRAPPTR